MTRDQLIAMIAACPVTLEHAAQSAGMNPTAIQRNLKDREWTGKLMKRHAELTGEWIAAMATELVNIEAEQPEE